MKRLVKSFFLFSAAGLLLLPALNIYSSAKNNLNSDSVRSALEFKKLYNMDVLMPYVGYMFYSIGVSISPDNSIIGKDGWLYLGDAYANTMTEARGMRKANPDMVLHLQAVRKSWDQFARENDSAGYFVSIAPNKQSVVKEKLPDWAAIGGGSNNINLMFSSSLKDDTAIDLSPQLKMHSHKESLYYKTDTHWNYLGAWYGFKELCESISRKHQINCLSDNDVSFSEKERQAGDLSRFLRISEFLNDKDQVVSFRYKSDVMVKGWDGVLIRKSDLNDVIYEMNTPLHTTSSNAKNKLKVLWLRDSFGISMYPYFNATFSDVMQRHYDYYKKNPAALKELVRSYHPDLIIVTAVERNYDSGYFFMKP
ncbi:alginate O-acetyltransferase AlgX-related protein [Cronobacter sakazakii]